MRLAEVYQVIQWMIAKKMLELLRYDGEKSLKEWADKHEGREDELNAFVLSALVNNRQSFIEAVTKSYEEAEELIREHIEREWGFDDIEIDSLPHAEETINFLNENVIRSLYSTSYTIGMVERTYHDILNHAREAEITDDSELLETLNVIVYASLKDGFYSGFVQSNGVRWRMDRYVNQVSKHIYQDTYTRTLQQALYGKGVELVKVHKFVNPRDACAPLQESGVICIVPRSEASEEAQQYPNIFDPVHKTGKPDGHRGINCRHLWHSLDSAKDRSPILYDVMDAALLKLEVMRLNYNAMLRRYL